jgi:U32 family peptidase
LESLKKPELLAPAGSIESFHAAIDAGADAVYLGLTEFNARLRAKNFTVKTLSFLVPYAHAKRRKIYVTLNTLVKQAELEPCVHLLHQLSQIGVDAIIVQDLGIADICRRAFPRLKVHASTQMAIHNSLGLKAAGDFGIHRVVLSRELTIDELSAIRRKSTLELEVFVHGALCYCFSGLCLASSFLGGSSGNRGRCTQVCRRPFKVSGVSGLFYSPADYCALLYIDKLINIGINSFKIEGRMKNEDYVFSTVAAYRKAIDNPKESSAAAESMDADLGRRKCSFFLDGVRQESIIDPTGPSGTGIPIGTIEIRTGPMITVVSDQTVSAGDFVRIQPESGFEGKTYRVAQSEKIEGKLKIELKGDVECNVGDSVYVTRHAASVNIGKRRNPVLQKSISFSQFYPKAKALLQSYFPQKSFGHHSARRSLSLIIDDPEWLGMIDPTRIDGLVTAFERKDVEKYLIQEKIPEVWQKKIILRMPPFVAEADMEFWKNAVRALAQKGIRRVMCANIGQLTLLDQSVAMDSDSWLWCFNRATQKALFERGVRHFSYSIEDDFPNMRSAASQKGLVYLYCHVPLFISRIKPAVAIGEKCKDSFNNEFFTVEKDGLYYLVAKKPLCLFQRRKKLEEAGINSFIIDLSFCKPESRFLKDMIQHYEHEGKVEGSGMFNFKLGIR